MQNCKRCKVEIIESAKYCHKCGLLLNKKYSFINNECDNNKIMDKLENKLDEAIEEVETLKKEVENLKLELQTVQLKGKSLVTNLGTLRTSENFKYFDSIQRETEIQDIQGINVINPNSVLHITTNGNVGIGDNTPNARFFITDDSDFTIKTN